MELMLRSSLTNPTEMTDYTGICALGASYMVRCVKQILQVTEQKHLCSASGHNAKCWWAASKPRYAGPFSTVLPALASSRCQPLWYRPLPMRLMLWVAKNSMKCRTWSGQFLNAACWYVGKKDGRGEGGRPLFKRFPDSFGYQIIGKISGDRRLMKPGSGGWPLPLPPPPFLPQTFT